MLLEPHIHQAHFLDNALLMPQEYTHPVHHGEKLCSVFLVASSVLNRTLNEMKKKLLFFFLFSW